MTIQTLGSLISEFAVVKQSLRAIHDELPNDGTYDALKSRIYGNLVDVIRSESDLKFMAQTQLQVDNADGESKVA